MPASPFLNIVCDFFHENMLNLSNDQSINQPISQSNSKFEPAFLTIIFNVKTL